MVILCKICFEPYTSSGTNHAPYSTPCGHIIGKMCLDRIKEIKRSNQLECPFCKSIIRYSACHPIYGLTEEDSDSNDDHSNERRLEQRRINESIKQNFDFKEYFTEHVKGDIDFYDVNKEYVLVSGISSSFWHNRFFRFVNIKEKKTHSKIEFDVYKCSAVALNKYQNKTIEYCIGYKEGIIKFVNRSLDFKNVISKTKLINDGSTRKLFSGNSKIHSICFLDQNKIVFSIGKGMVRLWNKNNSILSKTKILKQFPSSECGEITNLISLNSHTCFGKMNDKIYAFNDNDDSYVVCYEIGREIITYKIDPTTSTLVVFYVSRNFYDDDKNSLIQSYAAYEIKKKIKSFTDGPIKERYTTSVIKFFPLRHDEFPMQLKTTTLFNIKNLDKYFGFAFLPNIKSKELEIVSFNGVGKCVVSKKMGDIDKCFGISFIDKNGLCSNENSTSRLAAIFRNKMIILDINNFNGIAISASS